MICSGCDYKKNAPNGICGVKKASDGLPIRCVGLWAKHKYFYLKRYLDIFTKAMRGKWDLYYIDLFAGCGKCRVRDTGEEIDGSALISLLIKYPFKKYFLIEFSKDAADTLERRIEKTSLQDRVNVIEGDCNEEIDAILDEIPEKSLSVAVIDPTGLHFKFDSIIKLTKDRKVDLVITFPEGMDIKRNLAMYIRLSNSILDDYIGDTKWRKLFVKDLKSLSDTQIETSLIGYYRKKLNTIGYKEIKSGEVLIRSSQRNLPLYYLLFASKHTLGNKFWREISKVSPTGQIALPLNNDSTNCVREGTLVYTSTKPKVIYKNYSVLGQGRETLVERVNDGSIIVRFNKTPIPRALHDVVCPHFLELKWAYGCPYDCSWCYLKGTFRFRPNGKEPVIKDYAKIEAHTRAFLEQVETPEILNTGEIADSLMFENGAKPFSKFIIPMFETQEKHKVLFLTKSNNIKHLLEIEPHNQVVMSFSLNAIPVANCWERAPKVIKRIEAAKKLYDDGYEVRIRIDPMVPIVDWDVHYLHLIDMIFERFIPARITLGSLRGLQSTINGCTDRSWVKYLTETSNWGKKIDTNIRYQMYKNLIKHLKSKYKYKNIGLCKETIKVWNMLRMDYRKIKCNCTW